MERLRKGHDAAADDGADEAVCGGRGPVCARLPRSEEPRIIARQLMRAATSVGANYRAAQRGRSRSEFAAKLGIVIEEADETLYWIELLEELDAGDAEKRRRRYEEASELVRIVVAATKSARRGA